MIPRILEEHQNLFNQGYLEVIGIRDLYPLTITDLERLEQTLKNGLVMNGVRRVEAMPNNTDIIIAVHEIEAWFLAESNHFTCIDMRLTQSFIQSQLSILGYNLYTDDLTLRLQPSQDLKTIYQLVGKTYSKKKNHIERTVECLDYTNLYFNLSHRIQKLNQLIIKINAFLNEL